MTQVKIEKVENGFIVIDSYGLTKSYVFTRYSDLLKYLEAKLNYDDIEQEEKE